MQVFSCNDIDSHRAILNDIKYSQIFIDFVEEKEICTDLTVSGYLYDFCFVGSVFVFDYPDISDYVNENCFGENTPINKKFKEFEKLSDSDKACLKVYITEVYNNKVAVEITPENWRINERIIYLYEIFPDKSVKKLKEMVLIVE
ncbi:MAG: hypothetical protein COW66_08660 [Flavobacteriaceae bacterium CG18_big_fil_WC_8_21_14_2_50_34_36]|nr:MAG: hypothetical protein COW66_08660 [Flavobacteriaceae bacterium CG18_big_fil_WC_8_21_14_2_50_34_36]PIV50044.1 MAG: hypothetical protein COS19_05505 [Flavobacteriaceae bacterium CG02_land_8_20_14_3_00_34_13]PIZ09007.1 MAG: hypothetical protein COY56_00990 [Flavobacteriaceae bacterium CG_4_10_14_0_8_um_filter_34_31]PJC06294.1 MAG: hypothetical protein CO068_11925 [Flavobacteriaceae bacterium CG_4_9_14_0_8_um_filter_34_30]